MGCSRIKAQKLYCYKAFYKLFLKENVFLMTLPTPKKRPKLLVVFGTRPEAIKMAPLVLALKALPQHFQTQVCVTAQHRQMLDQVLRLFEITPDLDLNVMKPNQDLFELTTAVLQGIKQVLRTEQPDLVLVHGDTTTTFATSLACYYERTPLAHVEAGLRTFNKDFPFPEEINRVLTDATATWCFAPTTLGKENLLRLGVPEKRIVITGNTVIDALHYTLAKLKEKQGLAPIVTVAKGNRLLLATVHRRENFGEPLQDILNAFLTVLERFPDTELALPVHPNPNVKPLVEATLGKHPRVHLLEPLDYEPFCQLMSQAYLVLTDSGGLQEEAPALGLPVLVLRDETERPEATYAGTVKLVGPHYQAIVDETSLLLSDASVYTAMSQAHNPFGDGTASQIIVNTLLNAYSR
jgi:UDP-N-acetylglucosamine 2-epimerase (non-hydrolysing)